MTTSTTSRVSNNAFTPNPALMKWRFIKDRIARLVVTVGGLSVIFAVVLIFFYLAWVVLPLFKPADMEALQQYSVPGGSQSSSLLYSVDQQAEVGLRVSADGSVLFFDVASGAVRAQESLDAPLQSAVVVDAATGVIATQSINGQVHLLQQKYTLNYAQDGVRTISPRIHYPYGVEGVALPPGRQLAVRDSEDRLTLASADHQTVSLRRYAKSQSFFDDSVSLEQVADIQLSVPVSVDQIVIDPLQEWLYVLNYTRGEIYFYDIRRLPLAPLLQVVARQGAAAYTAANLLAGGISLVTANAEGQITQWFPVRDEQGDYSLQRVRDFVAPRGQSISALLVEQSRRSFISMDAQGQVGVYFATSERTVMSRKLNDVGWRLGAISPRADVVLLESANQQLHVYALHNEHPEISWKALWGKIWYESYPEPQYVWQSSSASGDFEPKFSLSPLSFGTLKAAFYAMVFAVPLALGGAIFTAYFMSAPIRRVVKPSIEIMEALPTVILGFLAGLWLAPFVENNLPGVFLMLLLLPLSMLLSAWLWQYLPQRVRHRVPTGWQPALLVLPVVLACAVSLLASHPVETAFFGGSMPSWLDNSLGIDFDQRNSLVVGIAMGFAVIPTIFSIAEDAIFSVPKQLTQGSLALGASPWQTLVRVILPTASPGIFSALMIGMGRAVGETMIVLMATGNTPIMDFNIFEGFRTLSANIAVEMPESEVGSTHFRILFLAGMVLFLFTFVVNTVAELVRQRLRNKYSSL